MATTLSSPLSDAGGCLICQRLALAVVLVVLGNTSTEIIRCFSIHSAFRGISSFTPTLQPDTARLPVQSVPVTIRQRHVLPSVFPSRSFPVRSLSSHRNLV